MPFNVGIEPGRLDHGTYGTGGVLAVRARITAG
jgi:hypothetical protein